MTFGDMTFGDMTFGDMTFGDMTFGGMTFGGMTFGGMTFGGMTFGDMTFGGMTFGGMTFGDTWAEGTRGFGGRRGAATAASALCDFGFGTRGPGRSAGGLIAISGGSRTGVGVPPGD